MALKVLPHSDRVLVEPYWDAEKIGSLYIPDSYADKEPQQGVVLDAGQFSEWKIGQRVLFHRFRAEVFWWFNQPRMFLHDEDIVTAIDPVTHELQPRGKDVVIDPDWQKKYDDELSSKTIFLPPMVTEWNQPVQWGRIIQVGYAVRQFVVGDYVMIPQSIGSEIGLIDKVVYFIPEREILAKHA